LIVDEVGCIRRTCWGLGHIRVQTRAGATARHAVIADPVRTTHARRLAIAELRTDLHDGCRRRRPRMALGDAYRRVPPRSHYVITARLARGGTI
jgi:hypothetical protein